MEQHKNPATLSATADPRIIDESLKGITASVNALSESFGKVYERLTYAGFVSVLGAILAFVPLVLGMMPLMSASPEEQRLCVASGVVLVVVGGLSLTAQNLLIYRLNRAKQEIACRMLAIRVAAMGEAQAAVLAAMNQVTDLDLSADPFKVK